MGGFQFISRSKLGAANAAQTGPRSSAARAAAGALLTLALLGTPSGPIAAETGSGATTPFPGPAREARVSTSPEDHAARTAPAARPTRPMRVVDDEGPPLTRAAARRRVESMTPARWLEHFGPVTVERRK